MGTDVSTGVLLHYTTALIVVIITTSVAYIVGKTHIPAASNQRVSESYRQGQSDLPQNL